jgi:hypothetical protein
MGNFLENLASRSLQPVTSEATRLLQPRLPSLFESPGGADDSVAAPNTDRQVGAKSEVYESASERDVLPALEKIKSSSMPVEPQRTILEHVEAEPTIGVRPSIEASNQPERGAKRSRLRAEESSIHEVKAQASLLPEEHESKKAVEHQSIEPSMLPQIEIVKSKSESKPILAPLPITTTTRVQDSMLEPTAAQESVVHIHIGRIDVRAVTPSQNPVTRIVTQKPRLTLDDYLRQRDEGKR